MLRTGIIGADQRGGNEACIADLVGDSNRDHAATDAEFDDLGLVNSIGLNGDHRQTGEVGSNHHINQITGTCRAATGYETKTVRTIRRPTIPGHP